MYFVHTLFTTEKRIILYITREVIFTSYIHAYIHLLTEVLQHIHTYIHTVQYLAPHHRRLLLRRVKPSPKWEWEHRLMLLV